MSKSKRNRFIVVALVIVIVVIAAVAYLSAGTTATTMTVAQAADASAHGKKVKVEGAVVDNSFAIDGDTLTFQIVDANTAQPRPSETALRLSARVLLTAAVRCAQANSSPNVHPSTNHPMRR